MTIVLVSYKKKQFAKIRQLSDKKSKVPTLNQTSRTTFTKNETRVEGSEITLKNQLDPKHSTMTSIFPQPHDRTKIEQVTRRQVADINPRQTQTSIQSLYSNDRGTKEVGTANMSQDESMTL